MGVPHELESFASNSLKRRTCPMHHCNIKPKLEEHHKDCFGWALYCCNQDIEVSNEVLQNSYLKMLERQNTFKGNAEFKTWAFAIIKNTAIDALRKRKKEAIIISENNIPDTSYDAGFEFEFDKKQKKLFFSEALYQLSDRQNQILQLVFYHDLSLNQTAEVLNLSPGSVRKYYDRAKKALAEWFQKKGIVEF